MQIIKEDSEERLISLLSLLPNERAGWRAQLLKLGVFLNSQDGQMMSLLTSGILNDRLAGAEGAAFFCEDGDVVLVCRAVARRVLDELVDEIWQNIHEIRPDVAIFQIATLYDLSIDWRDLLSLTRDKCSRKQFRMRHVDMASALINLPSEIAPPYPPMAAAPSPQPSAPPLPSAAPLTASILLVDDDPASLLLTKKALAKAGTILTAEDGASACENFHSANPKLVFLDIGLPDTDGHTVLEDMLAANPDAFIVMLSANSKRTDVLRAMQSGARGFVGKPFSREKLWHYVHLAGILPADAALPALA